MKQEQEIFERAMALPSCETREGYLREACGQNRELRRSVDELLAAFNDAGAIDFLKTGDRGPEGRTALIDARPEEGPGTVIGRYKLLQKIAEGGMGVVYMAEQEEPVRRRVALKIIKLGMDTKSVIARFEAERQALAMMDHPNIAKVLDGGATDAGRPYFVMELVRGVKITEYCDEAKLSTGQRLDLFIQVCQAIQHAHQKAIIHRDIKPSNILVTINDGVPVPKVIDFGIAKATEGRLTDKTLFTQFEALIGTPAYMSPEQAVMTSLDIDTRSDIYSLGVLLYELLAGSTPFDAKELLASGLDAMRQTIREQEPVRPSTRLATLKAEEQTTTAKRRSSDPPRLIHLLRGDLDWIVMKCLEKDRTRRYETANGLARDIERHLNNEPVMARPPSAGYRLQKSFRRNKLLFTAAAVVGFVLVLGVVVTSWQAIRATKARRATEIERERAQKMERVAKEETKVAEEQRERAMQSERSERQNLYAAEMNLAMQALEANNLDHVLDLLNHHRPAPGQPDLRGWEWRYLWNQAQTDELQKLGSHSNTVHIACFSAKGDFLATGDYDGIVKLWDMATMREAAVLNYAQRITTMAFSPDGTILTTGCDDRTLRLWDIAAHRDLARLPTEGIPVAISPVGDLVALVDSEHDGNVVLWDSVRRTKLGTLLHDSPQLYTVFSPDGKMLASGYWDKLVCVWDVTRKEQIFSVTNELALPRSFPSTRSIAFSSDSRLLAYSTYDGVVRLCDLATRQVTKPFSGHRDIIWAVAFSADDRILASAAVDRTAKIWDVRKGKLVTTLNHLNEVWGLAISPDGCTVATGTKNDGTVALWSTTPKPKEQSIQEFPAELEHPMTFRISISADATTLVTAYASKTIGVWDTAALKERATLPLDFGSETQCEVSPAGTYLAIGEENGTVKLLEVASLQEMANPAGRGAAIEAMAFSPDGKKLAWATADRKILIWETASKHVLAEIAAAVGRVSVLTFSADAARIGVGHNNGTTEIFDVKTRRRLALLRRHKSDVSGIAFLDDGKVAATASYDQSVKIWDIETQRELKTLPGQRDAYFDLVVSPDGRRLAGAGGDMTVKLWDTKTYQEVATLRGNPQHNIFERVAFSPDGNALIAGSSKAIYRWRAPSLSEIDAKEAKEKRER